MKATLIKREGERKGYTIKAIRGGYFAVISNYDHSMSSMELSYEAALNTKMQLETRGF